MSGAGPALAAAASGAGLAAVGLLSWLAGAPPPKSGAKERIEQSRDAYLAWLRVSPTFDQLLSAVELDRMEPDGKVCGSIAAEGALLSAAGALHEGGLMLLVDCMTALASVALGARPGVSIQMGATVLEPAVHKGERLNFEASVVRSGNTTAFRTIELWRAPAVDEGEWQLVAVGEHTVHIGAPFLERAWYSLLVRSPALARWDSQRRLDKLHSLHAPKIAASTMEEALGVQPLDEAEYPDGGFWANIDTHLVNTYCTCHGAAAAGMLAQAVREQLQRQGKDHVFIREMTLTYTDPVPAYQPFGLIPRLVSSSLSSAEGPWHFVVELRDETKVYVQGRMTGVAAW